MVKFFSLLCNFSNCRVVKCGRLQNPTSLTLDPNPIIFLRGTKLAWMSRCRNFRTFALGVPLCGKKRRLQVIGIWGFQFGGFEAIHSGSCHMLNREFLSGNHEKREQSFRSISSSYTTVFAYLMVLKLGTESKDRRQLYTKQYLGFFPLYLSILDFSVNEKYAQHIY